MKGGRGSKEHRGGGPPRWRQQPGRQRPHGEERAGGPRPIATDREKPHIWGHHAVAAALANPARQPLRLLLTAQAAARLGPDAQRRGLKPEPCEARDLDRLLGPATVHQGALLVCEPLAEPSLTSLVEAAATGGPVVLLDQVTDPHNVGAILRSAAVLGASGLVMTRRHSPPLDGALAKAASGALELVPIALVGNLARALDDLSEAGLRLVGLDDEATVAIGDGDLAPPLGLVLGSEGEGMRRLTREHCDLLVRIPGAGRLASLNVSNAAAIALYAAAEHSRDAARPIGNSE